MILEKLEGKFAGELLEGSSEKGMTVVICRKDRCHDLLHYLRDDPEMGFTMLMDLCGVDYLKTGATPRFEVVLHLYALAHNRHLRLRIPLPEADLALPTVTDLWPAADWFERETYDLFGIRFNGHPNLRRLFLPDGFEGHPLRKDYPIDRRQKIFPTEEKL